MDNQGHYWTLGRGIRNQQVIGSSPIAGSKLQSVSSQSFGNTSALVSCQQPLVRSLAAQGPVRAMVIVIVLPLTQFVVEQMDVVTDAIPV
jgi:hypothetical protein